MNHVTSSLSTPEAIQPSRDKPSRDSIAIEAKQLSYRYANNDYFSVNDVSLQINKGQCVGIIGPNGAGKSTLISLLCGLMDPGAGQVIYFPEDNSLSLQQNVEKYVALIPQEYAFYPELSVQQNLQYFIALAEKQSRKRAVILEQSLSQCQLEKVAKQKAHSLSGGYKRRLNIAIALSKSPQIIFLDEPTVGIDPVSRQEIISLLKQLKSQGKTLIYTSHLLNEVEQLCDEVVLLEQGRAIAVSHNLNNNMRLSFELIQACPQILTALKNQNITVEQDQTDYQIQLNNTEHLLQVLTCLMPQIAHLKSLHFSQNSLDQLYFKSYKANRC